MQQHWEEQGKATLLLRLMGTAAVVLWSVIATTIILYVLKKTLGLRVSEEQEYDGLDISLHGESAYN